MKVYKKIYEHLCRTDIFYYCPGCDILLWNSMYFPYPMVDECPICKTPIEWDDEGLKYYEEIHGYAIDDEVVKRYKDSLNKENSMKLYKEYYDEKLQKISYVSFDANNEKDFSNDPETNFTEAIDSHSADENSVKKYVEKINRDIENKEVFIKKCKDCNKYFILPKDELYWFKDRNLQPPKRCPFCRGKNKQKELRG